MTHSAEGSPSSGSFEGDTGIECVLPSDFVGVEGPALPGLSYIWLNPLRNLDGDSSTAPELWDWPISRFRLGLERVEGSGEIAAKR